LYDLAFRELALSTFLRLLDVASGYLDAFHEAELRWGAGHEAEGGALYALAFDELALRAGLLLRTLAGGWGRFCERLCIPPFCLWRELPGFERLQDALELAREVAFTPEWMPASTESFADGLEEQFRRRVEEWWGGEVDEDEVGELDYEL